MFNKERFILKMPKKESSENLEPSEVIKVDQIIEPSDEFDLSVLKTDFDKAEKEAREAIQENLIEKADFQREAETLRSEIDEKELAHDFKEMLSEVIEMVLVPINKSFRKKDISKLDTKFIDKFTDKFITMIPKDKVNTVEKFLGISDKKTKAIVYLRVFRFISFVFKELYTRFDEWQVYKEAHETGKVKQLPEALE